MTHAKVGGETHVVAGSEADSEPFCEDDNDPKDVFAVYRGKTTYHSFHLVDVVNEFGKVGGFEAIIDRLSNKKPPIPIKNLRFMISPLSKVYLVYLLGYLTYEFDRDCIIYSVRKCIQTKWHKNLFRKLWI